MRVLVVEDHPIFRDGLLAALASAEDLQVVAAAGTAVEAMAALDAADPELALVDLALPDGAGIDVIREATARGVRVLVLTMSTEPTQLVHAIRAGARGYVVKGAGKRDIVAAIEAVAAGDAVFGAEVANLALAAVTHQDARTAAFPTLTQREHDVLELLALGLPNAGIATRLFLSEKTVRNHVSSILAKLGVETRHEAAEMARLRR
ncbi:MULTISPECIES: response regulator transcription factor [unclassified Nocardioides]|uniref:response regulator n=1 Tax=unclassified Nocardioides TaxID=2615069 RepID=UPI00005717E8|nr:MULTISPECIES: response regulator transcription factor [unclassified Nocardioides]ABL79488.1 response regulator receiver [Nocardioides sp. JS614]